MVVIFANRVVILNVNTMESELNPNYLYVAINFTIFLILLIGHYVINRISRSLIEFLYCLETTTTHQLRSEIVKNQVKNHIKNINFMQKYIGISIILLTSVFLILGSLVVYDSRDFFKSYFEQQKQKIEAVSHLKVDSLNIVVENQQAVIDSLSRLNFETSKNVEYLTKSLDALEKFKPKVIYVDTQKQEIFDK